MLESNVDLNGIHFADHKLTIEDGKKLFENNGWTVTE